MAGRRALPVVALVTAGCLAASVLGVDARAGSRDAVAAPVLPPPSGASETAGWRAVVLPAPPRPAVPDAPQPPAPSPRTRRDVVRLVVGGDVLLHDGLWAVAANDARKAGEPSGALDFSGILAPIRPLVAGADLAICHLETPLAPKSGPFSGYPVFSVPPQIAVALRRTGFDACTTASNHTVDQGFEGVRRTLRFLDAAGLRHAGSARTAQESRRTTVLVAHGIRLALLSYTYGTNGIPVDADRRWSVNLIDVADVLAHARRARAGGADAVVVALHWGSEYQHAPNQQQLRVARRLARSGAVDLVYGHHAHVVQPVRRLAGTWVAFGLGNLVAQQSTAVPGVYEGMLACFDLVRSTRGDVSVRYAGYRPTMITRFRPSDPAMRVVDVVRALRTAYLRPAARSTLVEVRNQVAQVAGPRGDGCARWSKQSP